MNPTRYMPLILTVLFCAMVTSIGLADHAAAADASVKDVGKNLSQVLTTWAGWLFAGVTALWAIPYLAKRDLAGGLTFAGMAFLVGGFVLAGPTVADLIESLYKTAATGA